MRRNRFGGSNQGFLISLFCMIFVFSVINSAVCSERKTVDLNGEWFFLPRLSDAGIGGRHRFEAPDACHETWRKIEVPSCYQRQFEDLAYFEGVSWYAREFNFDGDPELIDARVIFEGVNYKCRVWLNGEAIGEHEGGYTGFSFPVRGFLKNGKNTLTLRVDNRRELMNLPGNVGWQNYGGIYRPVCIEIRPKTHIEDIYIRTKEIGSKAVLGVEITLAGEKISVNKAYELHLKLQDKEGRTVVSAKKNIGITRNMEKVTLDMTFNSAEPWSPENPYLYKMVAELKNGSELIDQLETSTGVRTFSTQGREFLLNEKPITIRGICYMYDYPETGRTLDSVMFSTDLDNFRDLGVNAIRAHFPMEKRMLDACDSLGILVWNEIPVYWAHEHKYENLLLAKQYAREMALDCRNRPSVVFWSLGNENSTGYYDQQVFFPELQDELFLYNPDAVTTCVITSPFMFGDIMGRFVDFFTSNIYPGWYCYLGGKDIMWSVDTTKSDFEKYEADLREEIAGCPVMPCAISEVGVGAVKGLYENDPWKLWSEDYQAYLIEKQLKMLDRIDEISAVFVFLYTMTITIPVVWKLPVSKEKT